MSDSKFFDLHVTGLGYLNRVRMVPVSYTHLDVYKRQDRMKD